MVILSHILKSSLSNSQTSLTLILEDHRFTGLGKLFWLNSIQSLTSSKLVLLSDPSLSASLSSSHTISIAPPNTFEKSVLETSDTLCIDSLEYLEWLIGYSDLYNAIKLRVERGLGTVVVINKSYMQESHVERYCLLAEIVVAIHKFMKGRGFVKCTHIRGFTKNTQENIEFEVIGDVVREAKAVVKKQVAPSTTFRLDVNEEEKKMREVTPLPYEKNDRLIKIEEQDYVSPDEEGDEDDFY